MSELKFIQSYKDLVNLIEQHKSIIEGAEEEIRYLYKQLVYWNNKITPRGWFMSWQLRMAANIIQGRIEEIDKQLAVAIRKKQWAKVEHLRKEKKRLEGSTNGLRL